MKNRLLSGLTTIVLSALIFTGCSKVPQAEIDAANAAVAEAMSAGADMYTPEDFIALKDSLNAVLAGVEEQGSKFIKNYSTAKEELTGVAQFAQAVLEKSEARKEELKLESQNTITGVRTLIETNRQLILQAPKGKEGTSALVAIKGELNTIETSVNEANTLLDSGEILPSLDKGKAAMEKATAINTELTEVIAKYKANVRK